MAALVAVTVTYLEMKSLADLVPADRHVDGQLHRAEEPSPEFNRFLYTAVGGDWFWVDRLNFTWTQWLELICRPGFETWYATVKGTPAGYFELEPDDRDGVEIRTFGLVPAFTGRGLGAWLLAQAVRRGFEMGANRVWLHTCTLDGPAALPNYLARGFSVFRVDDVAVDLPPDPPGPWPGASRPRGKAP